MPCQVRLASDHMTTLKPAAAVSLGIIALPSYVYWPKVDTGTLVCILPGWTADRPKISRLMPNRRGLLPALEAFFGYLKTRAAERTIRQRNRRLTNRTFQWVRRPQMQPKNAIMSNVSFRASFLVAVPAMHARQPLTDVLGFAAQAQTPSASECPTPKVTSPSSVRDANVKIIGLDSSLSASTLGARRLAALVRVYIRT